MRKSILSLLFLFSFQAYCLDWYDFDLDQTFILKKDLVFDQTELTLNKGNRFKLYDIISLLINVSLYQFEVEQCPDPNANTEMIIVDPSAPNNELLDASVGVQLQKSCLLEVYVETKDLFSPSLFELK